MNQDKLLRQNLGAERWKVSKGIGTLAWTPQFGKTFGAINFIINPHLKADPKGYVIILVPSEIILRTWEDNLITYGENNSRIAVFTANRALNINTLSCSLLVVDELHRFTTPERIALIDNSKFIHKFRLGLTGTYPTDNQILSSLYPIVDRITEQEAIEHDWISKFVEYNWLLELPDKDKIRYTQFSLPIQETLELFRGKSSMFIRAGGQRTFPDDFTLINACYSGFKTVDDKGYDMYIKYDDICNALAFKCGWNQTIDITTDEGKTLNAYWNPNNIHERTKNFMEFIRKRNELLINNVVKLYAISELLEMNPLTTICFNESIAFADQVADYIEAKFNNDYHTAVYHSKITSRPMINPITNDYFRYGSGKKKGEPKIFGKDGLKKLVIEGTRSGYYKLISTAKSLDEGVSIPNLQQVICTGGTTNPMTYQQRTSRGKTVDIYNPNKITQIFNLVFDDFTDPNTGTIVKSRDKVKLFERQKQTGNAIAWIRHLSELKVSDVE
jgi:superfamily II DNA or RNA helicase